MKKIFIALLTIFMITCSFGLTACTTPGHKHNYVDGKCSCGAEESYINLNEFLFASINNNTEYSVIEYIGNDTKINIPSTYKGKPVTRISSGAISSTSLTSVTIPNSITIVGDNNFYHSEELQCNIADNLKYLGNESNPYLYLVGTVSTNITSININANCKIIGSRAFVNCTKIEQIEIPNGVKSISSDAFYRCSSLENITIPNSVINIGDFTTSYFSPPLQYNIEDNLKYLGNNSNPYLFLAGTTSTYITSANINDKCKIISPDMYLFIDEIEVSKNHSNFKSIDGVLYSKDGKTLIRYPARKQQTSFTIPDGVTSIGDGAFYACDSLTSIEIPNSVTSIGDYAFYDCYNLTSIEIPNSMTSIGYGAFYYCSSLEAIEIPNGVKNIGLDAFYCCTSLVSIEIPGSMEYIGSGAFRGCSELKSITFEANGQLKGVGFAVFMDCDSLEVMQLPNNIVSLGDLFNLRSNMKFRLDIPQLQCNIVDNLKYIGNTENPYLYLVGTVSTDITSAKINSNCKFIGALAFYDCHWLTSIDIPESVTRIGDCAFYYCNSLTSVIIPASVTSIGNYAFCDCWSLTSVTLGNGVTSIGDSAFYYCQSLTSIEIPNGVKSIGKLAFSGCDSFTSITIPNSVTSIGYGAFLGCDSLTSTNVSERNSDYKSIDGILYSKDGKTLICYPARKQQTSFTIPDGVTTIGYGAFYACDSLTSIEIPNSVTSIGEAAFNYCESLQSINIPASVTSIGEDAFYNCPSLTSVMFAENSQLTSIGDYAFCRCESLTSIEIPEGVTSIGNYAFDGCYNLTICCEAESQPEGWNSGWNPDNRPVVWGYKG